MSDDIAQLTELYQGYGGNSDRTFGISPQEKLHRNRQSEGLATIPQRVAGRTAIPGNTQPLNPYLYSDLFQQASDAAHALNAIEPELLQITRYSTEYMMPAGFFPPNIIILDTELFYGWLEPEERLALLGHEIQHSKESAWRCFLGSVAGLMAVPGAETNPVAAWVLLQATSYRQQCEFRADDAGAMLTDRQIMQSALLKAMTFLQSKSHTDIETNPSLSPLEQAEQIEAAISNNKFSNMRRGGDIVARVHRLDDAMCRISNAESSYTGSEVTPAI